MATELATAYVSLVIESSKISGQVNRALTGLDAKAAQTGQSMGSKLALGLGAAFRTAAAGVALAGSAVIGTALSKGFGRMIAIDDARGKLEGLGHSAESVAEILKNANAAVTGTAFGMGEAATAAASAVAAGINQGEELTNYLKRIADTATIAGTSLGEMGYIFNKIQSSGKAYTADLNMLSERGIPIFKWLQDEYGKSAEELSKMVEKGEVDAATFRKVITENIGGAADASGNTLRGSWKNMQSALGRIGEAALTPFLPMMKSALAAVRRWADQIKPHVAKAATYVANGVSEMGAAFQTHGESVTGVASNWEKLGIKARTVVDGIRGTFSLLKDGKYLGEDMTFGFAEDSTFVNWTLKIRDAIGKLVEVVKNRDMESVKDFFRTFTEGDSYGGRSGVEGAVSTLGDALGKVGRAAAGLGSALLSLAGDTGIVVATGVRAIGSAMRFLADHSGVATAAMWAWVGSMVAAKAVHVAFEAARVAQVIMMPADIASRAAMTAALVAHNATLKAYLLAMGHEVAATQGMIRTRLQAANAWAVQTFRVAQATSALMRWSQAASAAAATATGLTAAMYRTAAASTAVAGRIQAGVTTAVSGLGKALSGAMSLIGGPWGAALIGAFAGFMMYRGHTDTARTTTEAFTASIDASAKAAKKLQSALAETNGQLDSKSIKLAGDLVQARISGITRIAEKGHSAWESFIKLGDRLTSWDPTSNIGGNVNEGTLRGYDVRQRAIDENASLIRVLQQQKLEVDDLGRVVAEGGDEYSNFIAALQSTDAAGARIADTFRSARADIQGLIDASANSTPGLGTLSEAVDTLASNSADADDRVQGLKKALDALSGKPVELDDAMQSYNDSIRDVIDRTQSEWDRSKGFGGDLIDPDGGINTLSDNGSKLRDVLKELRDETAQLAAAGGDMSPIYARNAEVIRDLGNAVGLTEPQIAQLAESVGYMPKNITILAGLRGASEAVKQLQTMKVLLDANREGVRIDTRLTGSDEIIRQLQDAGAHIQRLESDPHVFEITAPNIDNVIAKVDELISKKIPDKFFGLYVNDYTGNATPGRLGNPLGGGIPGGLPQNATGGTIHGPGTGTSDSILGIDRATGIPTSWVSRGEEVTAAKPASKWRWLLKMINRDDPRLKKLPAFAEGGTVPFGIEAAIDAAQSVEGNKYAWGGTGPRNFDCSGFVGWLHQIVMGIVGSTKRLYTTYSLIGGATAGLLPGLGPSGTWFRVGTSDEHMAATIAGLAVESGGAHGTSGIGGSRAKAEDSQFPHKFHLPNELIAGFGSLLRGGKMIEWTDEDERELTRLHLQVQRSKERRDEVYADEKSTPNDRQLADLDVQDAEAAVIKKQSQKDRQGQIEGGSRDAPEAPALSKEWTKEESERLDKEQAVQSARQKRNQVYDDPESTELDKQKADADYSLALQEAQKPDKKETDSVQTVRDIFTTAASNAVGAVFDAAKEQLPDKLGSSHWWDVADKAVAIATTDEDQDGTPDVQKALSDVAANPQGVMEQLGYTLSKAGQIPPWALLAPPKVFDSGGWLRPGETAINLSSRPEPIFNSPEQLRQFGGSLQTADAGISREEFERAILARPNLTVNTDRVSQGVRAFRSESNRQARVHKRR